MNAQRREPTNAEETITGVATIHFTLSSLLLSYLWIIQTTDTKSNQRQNLQGSVFKSKSKRRVIATT